jgi:subtilisin family serine protease
MVMPHHLNPDEGVYVMCKNSFLLTGLALAGVIALPAFGAGAVPDELFAKAAAGGVVSVIIELNVGVATAGQPSATDGEASEEAGRAAIGQAQQEVLTALQIPAATAAQQQNAGVKNFVYVPMMALPADAKMLEVLQNHPRVKSVVLDELSMPYEDPAAVADSSVTPEFDAPLLGSSIPVIGANIAQAAGVRGAGQVVAVLDTGVQKTHPFLSGKVVSEACYSTTNSAYPSFSVCPGGVAESTASGSGVNCDVTVSGCQHGTHVAGIAAGRGGGSTGVTYSGVAPDAQVIAVQVFSRFTSGTYCSSPPCVLSFTSDQIKGLERVYALRNTYKIAAINMSLGGGRNLTYCDSDSRKPIIDLLRGAGIATVIASGNDGWTDSVGAPGCISTAVTVGATDDADNVASFSNIDDTVDFLAPGVNITSSIPIAGGSAYATWNGTSMATPHVAGAFALFKGLDSLANVSELESRLAALSVQVDDNRSSGIQDNMDRIALAWMGNNRCFPSGKVTNQWGYDSGLPFTYISLQPDLTYGNNFAYLIRIPNNTSLAGLVNAATGRAANLGAEPTVSVRGSAPCPTAGTLRYIYSGDYGFMSSNN